MKNIKFIIFIIVIAVIPLHARSAFAQGAQVRTMTIVPPAVEHSLNPGDKTEGIMKVINDSQEPVSFSVGIRDYIVVDKRGTPNFLPPNTLNQKYSAGAWIGVSPATFTLQPKEKQILTYYVQIPPNARAGGHYAGVVFTALNPGGLEGSGASIQTQVGTLFYLSVSGPITEKANVTAFTAASFLEYGPVKIQTTITNMGDLHITPEAKIKVYDMLGREIISVPLSTLNVFPQSSRDFQNSIGQTLMIGPFTAKLVGTYGRNDNLPLLASLTFWVFPWRITLVAVLIIIALILGWKYWKKRGVKINTDHQQMNADSPSKPIA